MRIARVLLRSLEGGLSRPRQHLQSVRFLSIGSFPGNGFDGQDRNSNSFESADDFERRIFGGSSDDSLKAQSFYRKFDKMRGVRDRYAPAMGNEDESSSTMDGLDESFTTLSDGMEGKLKNAATNFEYEFEDGFADEADLEEYELEYRPDVEFSEGMTYKPKDLDLSKPGIQKPFPRDSFETSTEEVLQKADFRNVRFLANFLTDAGIIIKRSSTGISAKAQRKLAREIKTARAFGLMPFTTMGTKRTELKPPWSLVPSCKLGGGINELAFVTALGSASTAAVTFGTATVCGIIAGEPNQRVQCYQHGLNISVYPNVSFEALSGGRSFFCGLRSGGFSIYCWETRSLLHSSFSPKRIYFNYNVSLADLAVGDDQVCAREVDSGIARCWRGGGSGGYPFPSPGNGLKFRSITAGSGFTCGILKENNRVFCWGGNKIGAEIQRQFGNLSVSNLVAGDSHACGLTMTGFLVCKGNNESGQLKVPPTSAFEFSTFALGANFSCGIRRRNGFVQCWGSGANNMSSVADVSFESIVSGMKFLCGLTTRNLTMICWGPGWSNGVNPAPATTTDLRLGMVIPGPCVQTSCNCGTYPNSETLCGGSDSGNICRTCQTELPIPVPLAPIVPPIPPQDLQPFPSPRKGLNRLSFAFLIVGSIGAFAGICTVFYCLWTGVCGILLCRTDSSVQPTVTDANIITDVVDNNDSVAPPLRSFSIKRNSSRMLGRQRSGSSSSKHAEKTQNFSLLELSYATNNFSVENRIGSGSFGVVYKGKLADGRKAVFKIEEDGTGPIGVVEYASPRIMEGDLGAVVDRRVGVPEIHEAEAVELMAYTALHCVNLEGKERPNMTDIVASLEKALSLCEHSPASLSSRTISIPSD
ncbi:Ribosomal protein S18 [Corchorus olitorius]|uniref:Small ribosomal subunit protein bS18c n=1 Tax=Corchorus olitorius TaxID=93759 RepID=A0A1R3J6N0_9ROSI|nr:Ribosomal protein S18 [Corchorus olitorius]